MKHVWIILQKQWQDTWKNKAVLIQFIMFPILAAIMKNSIQMDGMPADFFVNLFASMYVGMAPLISTSSIISEEKEKNTLRVLIMADVTPKEYLLGIGSYVFCACMFGAAVFCCLLNDVTMSKRILFFFIMAAGIIVSVLLGAAVGVGSKNQTEAVSVSVPVMMIFSFLPMLSMFNDVIAKVAKFTYSEQVRILVEALGDGKIHTVGAAVIAGNMLVFAGLFWILYRKKGLA